MDRLIETHSYRWIDMTPQEIEAVIESKIDEKLAPINQKLEIIIALMNKFEGAGIIVKVLFFGVAPVVAALVWLKNHVNL
jgi:hypothetical protein